MANTRCTSSLHKQQYDNLNRSKVHTGYYFLLNIIVKCVIYRKSHQWQLYLSLCVVPLNISHRHKSSAKLKGKKVSLSIANPNK